MNFKRILPGLLGGVALMLLVSVTKSEAQIWTEFTVAIENRIYEPLVGGTQIPRSQFVDLFNNFVNPDDGVSRTAIPLGFEIEYDGQLFTQAWVSINGFASFEGRFITNDPFTLFTPTNGPNLTLAPYFGDHYYRAPGFDFLDPQGRAFTPTTISWQTNPGSADPKGLNRRSFVVEWENVNINYFFDPVNPDDPFSPNRQAQAPSIASFQVWIFEADPNTAPSKKGTIEFHYGDAGTGSGVSIVKFSGASVGIEDEPAVPNGNTTWINAVTYAETGNQILSRSDTRLTSNWPPSGLPGRIFIFNTDGTAGIRGWGDGDATLTQVDPNTPPNVRADQRLFVTMADVIRILRHQAGRPVEFDSAINRHGYHGDVNHNGRFYYSTSNYDNTGDSVILGTVQRYKVFWPFKSTNENLPLPNDNTFNGFFFDADEFDASLIMTYLAAKLPVLPWLPDTLPHFTGKAVANVSASDIVLENSGTKTGRLVEIPITLNGYSNGAVGVKLEAAKGTRIVDVYTPEADIYRQSLAVAGESKVSIAAAGQFKPGDVIATIIVETTEKGEASFENVIFNEKETGAKKLNVNNTDAAAGELMLGLVSPNPINVNATASFNYTVPTDSRIQIRVFDILGKEIATIADGEAVAGTYAAQWNGRDESGRQVSPGMYMIRVEAAGRSGVARVQVVR
ncbi:MAG: FlgD immunoglobulin-like domain containing protein [Candidatus Kapaibacterium sp.]